MFYPKMVKDGAAEDERRVAKKEKKKIAVLSIQPIVI